MSASTDLTGVAALWEMFGDGFNEGHLLWLGGWGTAVLVALGLGVTLVLVLSYLDLREMRPRRRAHTLLLLRALVLGFGMLLLLEPALELRDVERDRNHVAFLVDGSRSMGVETPGGDVTRAERAAEAIDQLGVLYGEASEDHIFDFFIFGGGDESAQRTSSSALAQQTAQATEPDETRIREAIESVVGQLERSRLGGLVLVSDGADDGALGGRNPDDDEPLDADTAAFLSKLGVPVHVLAATRVEGLRDVSVERVLHDEFAFIRNRVAFDVTLRGLGVAGTGVQVELWENGQRVRSQQIAFADEDERKTVTFEVVPEKLGKSVYSVVASPVDDEALAENNRYHFTMKVIRDKIRVLQVCGQPSWDERFLRRLLKENPNVDLISFFILRTNSNLQLVPEDELSLIPFPKDELFDQELPSFDLVIFQNFNFGPYVLQRYLDRVAEFVRGGGGFVMLGGELSFSNGGYYGTPIGEVLPVELFAQGVSSESLLSTERFSPGLTDAGRRHPITRLSFDAVENRRLWESLPKIEGTNIVQSLKPDATALATHPTLRGGDGEPMPFIAVREVGDGRSMSLTSDSSWLWAFEHTGQGGTTRPYANFWNNAIRWLIQDPELKLIKVDIDEGQVEPGRAIVGRVTVLEPDYAPAPGVEGTWRVLRRPLDEPWDADSPAEVVLEQSMKTNERGEFAFELPTGDEGVYTIEAVVERGETSLDDHDLVLVVLDSPELRDIAPRNELLRKVARETGGRYIELPTPREAFEDLTFEPPRVTRINDRKLVSLWDTWLVFVVLASLLALEWLLRRRWGRL